MSTIQIEVPFEALSRPGVARALADLTLSLGGLGDTRPAAAAATPTAASTAPAAAAEKAAPAARAEKRPARPAARAARKTTESRRSRARRSAPVDPSLSPDERWKRYLEGLPETSRKFLSLLEERGRMTVSEAVEALELDSPKAMGGLTGAMRRWAPQQGIQLPFEAKQNAQGERYWVWTGKR